MNGMTHAIRLENIPKIHRARRFYTVTAYVTGVLLLLLVAEMVFKYAFHLELELGGPFGFLAFVQEGTTVALNLSLWVLIVHGWFYVVYLIAAYLLWMRMRWPLWVLLAMAGGGVVPFLSFVTEYVMGRRADREVAAAAADHQAQADEDAELREFEQSLSSVERAALDAEVRSEAARRAQANEGPRTTHKTY